MILSEKGHEYYFSFVVQYASLLLKSATRVKKENGWKLKPGNTIF